MLIFKTFLVAVICFLISVFNPDVEKDLDRALLRQTEEAGDRRLNEPREETETETPEATEETEESTEETFEDDGQVHTVSLYAVGDMLMHVGVSGRASMPGGQWNYDFLFENTKNSIAAADLAIVNNEVPFGGNERGLSGYPTFNVFTQLGDAEVKAGFDIIQCATNHSLDQNVSGIRNTLNFWKKYPGITVLGMHESQEDANTIRVVEKNGIKIAFLNYAYWLNGYSLPAGNEYMIDLMNGSTRAKIKSDLQRAEQMADFTVVLPHWGQEYRLSHNAEQEDWAKFFTENGADLIIGTHPHCPEDITTVTAKNGNTAVCFYSLGNYVSNQGYTSTLLGMEAHVTIKKEHGKTFVESYYPEFLVTHFSWNMNKAAVIYLRNYPEGAARYSGVYTYFDREPFNSENRAYPFTKAGLVSLAKRYWPSYNPTPNDSFRPNVYAWTDPLNPTTPPPKEESNPPAPSEPEESSDEESSPDETESSNENTSTTPPTSTEPGEPSESTVPPEPTESETPEEPEPSVPESSAPASEPSEPTEPASEAA